MKASCPTPFQESNRIAFGTILLCAAAAYGAIATAAASDTRMFHVREFGAVADGRTESGAAIRAAISEAIAAGNTSELPVEIVLEAGTYLVRPERPRTDCFPIRQATNLVVRGAGKATRIMINDPASAGFSFGLSRNISVRDLSVDYDPVPFCQGTIRAVDVDAGWFELDVEPGYPTPDGENFMRAIEPYGKWGMIMDRKTRRIRSGTPDHYMTPRWEHREGRVWRFITADEHHRRNLTHMREGDAYVHLARGHGSAVFAHGCDGIRIENVTIHAAPGLAVGLVGNRGEIVVRRLEVRFAADTTRLLTTNADGVHCQQNRAGPVIEDCYFEGMADDAINIYAPPNVLREVRSPTQWLVSSGTLILPGDRLQVLDPRTGALRGEVKAVEVTAESRARLLTLEAPLAGAVAGADHRSADTLYNLDACGAGFQIRRNQMNGHRRYGCLLRAGNGVVEDNTFADTTGAGVVLTNEPDWPEGPVPWDIAIRRNRFIRGGTCLGYADSPQGAALAVRASRLGHGLAEAESIRNVIIEDNIFVDRAGAAVFVGGASNVTLRGNHITAEPDAELRRRGPAILIERSSGVVLTDNKVSDPRPGTTAAIEVGRGVPPGTAGVSIADLKATLAPGAQPVLGIADAASSGAEGSVVQPPNVNWVRAGINTNGLRWGIKGRLLWGLPPPSDKATDGPRGLIRLYSPVLTNGGYDLLNFIAVEPVVAGVKCYSELEPSQLDDLAGKRLWAVQSKALSPDSVHLPAGELTRLASGVEILTLNVRVERFLNGAHVTLTIAQRSDAPDEIQLTIQAEPDSAPIDYCILTATMGNKARARHLWLKDERVSSLELYPDYRGPDFTPHRIFPLERLCRTPEGDILAAVTTDESDPTAAPAPPGARHWYYGGHPVTQYWRKPAGTWRSDLHVAVNARYTYWVSRHPIPGGISFENFELRERFHDGQQFNFGITRQAPADLGFKAVTSAGTSPPEAARGLIERLLPNHAGHFVLELIPRDPAGDVFEIETREGKVVLRGNNGVSLASALNWYLKYHCGCHHSLTGGSQLRLPDPLPEVAPKVRRVSSVRHRYFLNYCCFGYSLPWYDWAQWERLIDWMALNGVNLPLSVTGQEAVWQAVGRRLGWSEPELQAFLAGPPYLPFGWMGCLDGHGGPLPNRWIERHAELQQRILERQRAFGMTPVLQGFTGHVPATVTNRFPAAKLQPITWVEWNTFVLDPLDPLFPRIAAVFLEEQIKLFGTDHFYAADTFIEMTPPSGDTDYLADIGRAIFDGLRQTDPEATWVLQGWPFFYGRQFWTQPRIEAVLGAVPDERMLLLDLYCEQTPVWSLTRAFAGKPWLWCNIQNFGGRVWLGGALDRINRDFWAARNDPHAGRLSGLGFVNEGLDNNPVVFDLLFEMAWRDGPVQLESWLDDFAARAYGQRHPDALKAWRLFHETAFQAAFDNRAAYTLAPSLATPPETPYRNDRLAEGWRLLLGAADDLGDADPFRFDLVNVARQVLGNYSAELHRQVRDAFNRRDREALREASHRMLSLIRDLDALLATRREFLLGNWLEDARRWGETDAERDRLEWNARRVLTLWGDGTVLRDYACRQWSGLLNGFYLKRWELFFAHLDQALADGQPFDEANFAADMFAFEAQWAEHHDPHPREPQGDSLAEARRLWAKYGEQLQER